MKLAFVSDTHGHPAFTAAAAELLRGYSPDRVLHMGDVVAEAGLAPFCDWPVDCVHGNCDRPEKLRDIAARLGATYHGQTMAFSAEEFDGVSIAATHGDDDHELDGLIRGDWDLVLHGHTHVRRDETRGDVRIVNPGAIFRANPRSLATFDTETRELEFHTLEA